MKYMALLKELAHVRDEFLANHPDKKIEDLEVAFSNDEEGNQIHLNAEVAWVDEEKTKVGIFPLNGEMLED